MRLLCLVTAAGLCAPLIADAARPTPELFAPGTISGPASDGAPTFTPDGNTLYFTRSAATWSVIVESHRVGATWSEPQVAAFSGQWPDTGPVIAPDGSYLVFQSQRPKDPTNPRSSRASSLYRVDRVGAGWGPVQRLPDEINSGAAIWRPSIAADGTLYFVSIDPAGHKQLLSARRKAAGYEPAKPLPFSDGSLGDVDPEIAPDGSFLVFCSDKRLKEDPSPRDHLFVVRKTATGWGPVRPLRYAGDDATGFSTDNEPRLGPDHRTLYFSSDRSVPVAFPRAHDQAVADLKRLQAWDNGTTNVWSIAIDARTAE